MKGHKAIVGCIGAGAFVSTAIIILHRLRSSHKNVVKKPVEIGVFHPADITEVNELCISMQSGNVCIVDVTEAEHEMAQRIVDYLGGIAIAANGEVKRLSEKIFIMYLAPTEQPNKSHKARESR